MLETVRVLRHKPINYADIPDRRDDTFNDPVATE